MSNNVENNKKETTTSSKTQEDNSKDTVKETKTKVADEKADNKNTTDDKTKTEESNTETASSDVSTETTTLTETAPAPTSMSIPFIGLSVIQCVVAFLLIVVVLQQSKTATGMTSTMVGSGDNQSYWSQNKGRSKESKLARMTVILGVIFFIITVILGFIK